MRTVLLSIQSLLAGEFTLQGTAAHPRASAQRLGAPTPSGQRHFTWPTPSQTPTTTTRSTKLRPLCGQTKTSLQRWWTPHTPKAGPPHRKLRSFRSLVRGASGFALLEMTHISSDKNSFPCK